MSSRARLISDPTTPMIYTAQRSVDSRTAVTRGLAEYLEDSIFVNAEGGRQIHFKKVYDHWAEWEDNATFPSACIYATSPGIYDASRFTPGVDHKERIAEPDGRYVVALADLAIDLNLEIWCTDVHERMELVNACEVGLNPLDHMYGINLELPYYYNMRCIYELKSILYIDSEEEAKRRHRKALMIVSAQLPIVRLKSLPLAKPKADMIIVDTEIV